MALLDPAKVDTVVIHITDCTFGDVSTIDQFHKDRGWSGIGYHYLITNCFPTRYRFESKKPDPTSDGLLHIGRDEKYAGAHVKGSNWRSIGVAMIGRNGLFSAAQLNTAVDITRKLKQKYNITRVLGHYELTDKKTCPDLDMDLFRSWL